MITVVKYQRKIFLGHKAALPVTVPYKEGGSSGATANLTEGDWVFGVWLDNQKTKPLILASIGTTANASNTPPELKQMQTLIVKTNALHLKQS